MGGGEVSTVKARQKGKWRRGVTEVFVANVIIHPLMKPIYSNKLSFFQVHGGAFLGLNSSGAKELHVYQVRSGLHSHTQ